MQPGRSDLPLDEAALLISSAIQSGLDLDHWLSQLDELADGVRPTAERVGEPPDLSRAWTASLDDRQQPGQRCALPGARPVQQVGHGGISVRHACETVAAARRPPGLR